MSKDIIETMSGVKVVEDTTPDVSVISERAAQRLALLVDELTREYAASHGGKTRGAQSAIARMFGTDQGNLSKVMGQSRASIGLKTVEQARRALNLKHEYFQGPREPRSYHDYIGGDLDAPYEAWQEFLLTDLGKSMTAAQRRTLASTRYESGDPTVGLYQAHLLALQGLIDSKSVDRSEVQNRRLARENSEDRRSRKP